MRLYGKNFLEIFPRTSGTISMKLSMKHPGIKSIIVYSKDDPELTLTYFMARSKFEARLLLAHLSQRLIGELIGYPWSGVCRRPSTISNVFSSETAWPIKAKFYVEPPWQGGKKVYINGPGHMTKMAAMTIYGKNL